MREPENDIALRIGELAAALDTTTKTLRHYEKKGLISPSHRTGGGYRVYNKADLREAQKVLGLRRLGLSISEVQELYKDGLDSKTMRHRLLGLLDEQLRDIDESLAVLQGRRDDLSARYLALFDTPSNRQGGCICNALLQPCNCGEKEGTRD